MLDEQNVRGVHYRPVSRFPCASDRWRTRTPILRAAEQRESRSEDRTERFPSQTSPASEPLPPRCSALPWLAPAPKGGFGAISPVPGGLSLKSRFSWKASGLRHWSEPDTQPYLHYSSPRATLLSQQRAKSIKPFH